MEDTANTELELRKERSFLRNVLATIPDSLLVLDSKLCIKSANRSFYQIFNKKAKDVIGKEITDCIAFCTPALKARLAALLGTKDKLEDFEVNCKSGDGSDRILSIKASGIIVAEEEEEEEEEEEVVVIRDVTRERQAEAKARELSEYLQLQVDRMPVGLIVWDKELRVQSWNPAAQKIFGYAAKEVLGKHPYDIIVPEQAQSRVNKVWRRLLDGDRKATSVNENVRKDGQPIICYWLNTPLKNAGLVTGVLSMVQDITERMKAEEDLRKSEEKLRLMFETAADGVAVTDLQGNIIDVNKAALQLFGFDDSSEVIGLNAFSFFTQQDLLKAQEAMQQTLSQGNMKDFRLRARKKDSSEFVVEMTAATLKDSQNNPIGFIGVIRDITERLLVESRLEQAATEWQTTFDSIADMVSIHDAEFKLVRVNRAFASAWHGELKSFLGVPCFETCHIGKELLENCPHRRTLCTGQPAVEEFYEPAIDKYLEVSTSPLRNSKGEVTASVHIARDVTQRKEMQKQLIEQDRLATIGELASGVAHELNNPLTSVLGFSEMIQVDPALPDHLKRDMGIVRQEAERTSKIVKGLLTFARRQALTKQPVKINEAITNVLSLRAHQLESSYIKIITRLAEDLPDVMGDTFQLQQVFMNVIANAEHFMIKTNNGGTLIVATEPFGEKSIRILIADNGPGITEENMKHLFQPFFTTKEVGKGTGLGLSICHGIINDHGGKIWAESEPGHGATFFIELPVAAKEKA